ncbi:MAG: hypothetical protein IKY22_03905 [Bacteroidales bacterium]|nr:hypothetical protein [Bacteroidales bacterium]
MALIRCKECGELISRTAISCPKCGASQSETFGNTENSSVGTCILSLLLPFVGLIIAATKMSEDIKTARAYCIWAGIGFIFWISTIDVYYLLKYIAR